MTKQKSGRLESITESVASRLSNRVAGVLAVPIFLWGLHSLAQMHDDSIHMSDQLIQHETRITTLELWRDKVSYIIHGAR